MFRMKMTAAALVLTTLVAACGSDSTGPEPSLGQGTITLLNESAAEIVSVQFSLCSDDSWGSDRLGANETIAPGETRQWTAEPGCYDFRASTGSRTGYWYDRQLSEGGALNLALSSAASLTVETGAAAAALKEARQ